MKAIILAAGQGTRLKKYTENLPKGMLMFMGKTIIERQIDVYRACGISDIIIVRGFAAEKINYEGIKYYTNEKFATTNMVESLMEAKSEFDDDIIVSYSDVLFEPCMLKKMMEYNADFACAVDDNPNPDPTYPFDAEEYWNKTTSVMDFEDEDVSMFTNVNPNRMAITAAEDASMGKVAKFQCTNRNALPLGLYSFREMADKANKVIFEFDFNMGSVSGHHKITIGDADVHNATSGGFDVTSKNNYGYGPNGAIFQFGTDRGGGENYFKINDSIAANKDAAYAANDVLGQ